MQKTKVLVVDDDEQICEFTREILMKRKYQVFTATNEDTAMELIKKEHPHIALLDVRLGNISGMDVLRKIKELDKNIKIIMVTALDDQENVQQAKLLGADDYITKPFTISELNRVILQKIANLK